MPDTHASAGQEPQRPEPGWRRFRRFVGEARRAAMALMCKILKRRKGGAQQASRLEAENGCTGEAGVDSRSTIGIRCPVADRPASAMAPSVPPVALPVADADAGPFRVLVAEDTEMNRQLVRALLARMGCEVDLAENGQQALEAMEKRAE